MKVRLLYFGGASYLHEIPSSYCRQKTKPDGEEGLAQYYAILERSEDWRVAVG